MPGKKGEFEESGYLCVAESRTDTGVLKYLSLLFELETGVDTAKKPDAIVRTTNGGVICGEITRIIPVRFLRKIGTSRYFELPRPADINGTNFPYVVKENGEVLEAEDIVRTILAYYTTEKNKGWLESTIREAAGDPPNMASVREFRLYSIVFHCPSADEMDDAMRCGKPARIRGTVDETELAVIGLVKVENEMFVYDPEKASAFLKKKTAKALRRPRDVWADRVADARKTGKIPASAHMAVNSVFFWAWSAYKNSWWRARRSGSLALEAVCKTGIDAMSGIPDKFIQAGWDVAEQKGMKYAKDGEKAREVVLAAEKRMKKTNRNKLTVLVWKARKTKKSRGSKS